MDLQSRKLEFIKEFLTIQSEELISRLETMLKSNGHDFEPLTIEELNSRIDKSLDDSQKGRLTEANDLITEIKQWQ